MRSRSIEIVVERRHFAAASVLTGQGLRAADALHLAIANDIAAAMATRDAVLVRVAELIGLPATICPD